MVLVLVDHDRGRLDELSMQAVAFASGIAGATGDHVEAVLVGETAESDAADLGKLGVSKVHLAVHPELTEYAPLAWARACAQLVDEVNPAVVVAVGSDRGNETMAHLAALTDRPFAADCISLTVGDPVFVVRARWGGSLLEEAEIYGAPALVTVAPHTVAAATTQGSPDAVVVTFTPQLHSDDLLSKVTQESSGATGGVTLADAKVVVSGGRGVGGAEGFTILEELAGLLDGAVGCSRVVTSAGWRPHTDQVGQTGTKVAPDLYIACGISGATQHLAGCRTSKNILVINNDPDASILAQADFAVIGDLHTVLPAIIAETRKAKS